MRRTTKRLWRVSYGTAHGLTCLARTRGNAVHKFRQSFPRVTLKTDHETGGWHYVSAEVVTPKK